MKFLFYGFVWLFIFSIPVSQTKNLFDVCHENIVESDTVKSVKSYVLSLFNHTKEKVSESVKEEKKK